jgi:quinol monooxygenase YgiN
MTLTEEKFMVKLDPNSGFLVLINTFTVDPAKADELLAVLSRASEERMRHMPGFISASLHLSGDKRYVANYAQWRSKEDLEAMMKNPDAQVHMREAAGLAISYQPIYYDLRESHLAAGGH